MGIKVRDKRSSEVNTIDRKRERGGDRFLSNELDLSNVLRRDRFELLMKNLGRSRALQVEEEIQNDAELRGKMRDQGRLGIL
jgi:hypothetical protein